MVETKGRKCRPSLGINMVRQNQRGRWEEFSSLDRKIRTFLNFLLWIDLVFDILNYSSGANSLSNGPDVTGAQEVRL